MISVLSLLLNQPSSNAPYVPPPPPVGGASTTLVPIAFADVNGNPLPANTRVDFFAVASAPTSANVLASAYVGVTSQVFVGLTLAAIYRAQYVGEGAPVAPSVFTLASANGLTITPTSYVSPWANLKGYADLQASEIWPLGRVSNPAASLGGGARVLMETYSSTFAQLDIFGRTNAAGERLYSSSDPQIDSWVADFLGTTFPRLPQETGSAYITRVIAWLGQAFTTEASIRAAVAGYFAAFPDSSIRVDLFDRQTDPRRASYYGLLPGQFAIAEYYQAGALLPAFYTGQSFLGQDSFLEDPLAYTISQTPIYPELDRRIRRVKADGTVPVYIVTRGEASSLFDVATFDQSTFG